MNNNKDRWERILVVNLLYPAVLGAIFVNLLPWVVQCQYYSKDKDFYAMSTILVVIYFCIDYIYVHRVTKHRYSVVPMVGDIVALYLVFRLASVLNTSVLNPNVTAPFTNEPIIYLGWIHVIFFIWAVIQKTWAICWLSGLVIILLIINLIWVEKFLFLVILCCMVILYIVILAKHRQ
jgi:hypothetical protein